MRGVQFNERLGVRKLSSLPKRAIANAVAATCVTLGILNLVAQASWKDKDWTKWSREECGDIMNDSPWAQTYSMGGGGRIDQFGSPTRGGAGSIVEFRSALPIRQAWARVSQLNSNYNKMKPEQREAIDQKTAADLAISYDDRIVIWVHYAATVVPSSKFVADPPEAAVFIVANGMKLRHISVRWINKELPDANGNPDLEFELTYPRIVNGQPVIKPTDKKITFIYGSNYGRAPVTFDPSKMMYQGKLEY